MIPAMLFLMLLFPMSQLHSFTPAGHGPGARSDGADRHRGAVAVGRATWLRVAIPGMFRADGMIATRSFSSSRSRPNAPRDELWDAIAEGAGPALPADHAHRDLHCPGVHPDRANRVLGADGFAIMGGCLSRQC